MGGSHIPVPIGAEAIVRTGGGGGWGEPLERDASGGRARCRGGLHLGGGRAQALRRGGPRQHVARRKRDQAAAKAAKVRAEEEGIGEEAEMKAPPSVPDAAKRRVRNPTAVMPSLDRARAIGAPGMRGEVDDHGRCRDPCPGRLASVRRAGRRAVRAGAAAHVARYRARRTALPDRAERLRQEHAAQHDRRPADADHRHGRGQRQAGARAAAARHRLRVPGERAVSLVHDHRERQARHGVPGRAEGRAGAARAEGAGGGRAQGLHGPLSGAAFRRHAAARGAGARAQPGDRHAADGRAVRRARRADPDDPRRGPLGAAVHHRQDHRVRHPFARRSGVPRRPRRGVLGAAGPHQGDHRGRRAASAQARLRHHGKIQPAAQHALRAAARGNPQGGRAVGDGGGRSHERAGGTGATRSPASRCRSASSSR